MRDGIGRGLEPPCIVPLVADPLDVGVRHLRRRIHGIGNFVIAAADMVQPVARAAAAGVLGVMQRRRSAAVEVQLAVVDGATDEEGTGHGGLRVWGGSMVSPRMWAGDETADAPAVQV